MTFTPALTGAWFGPALLAVPLFAVTNADDLVVLTVFFANHRTRAATIVVGQLVGIGILTAVSIVVARLAVQLPENWLPLLGLVPLVLGIRQLTTKEDDNDDETSRSAVSWWLVTTITVANGSDNLGVYIPVFAVQTITGLVVISAMFAVLTFAWCGLAAAAVRHPTWGKRVAATASAVAPYVFIAVGLWILSQLAPIQQLLGRSG